MKSSFFEVNGEKEELCRLCKHFFFLSLIIFIFCIIFYGFGTSVEPKTTLQFILKMSCSIAFIPAMLFVATGGGFVLILDWMVCLAKILASIFFLAKNIAKGSRE